MNRGRDFGRGTAKTFETRRKGGSGGGNGEVRKSQNTKLLALECCLRSFLCKRGDGSPRVFARHHGVSGDRRETTRICRNLRFLRSSAFQRCFSRQRG